MMDQLNIPAIAFRPLAKVGLKNFAPGLMNRTIGRYNVAMHEEMAVQGVSTPQMRSLAFYAVVPQSTLHRAWVPRSRDGLTRRETDAAQHS